jgi:hypothetical protein
MYQGGEVQIDEGETKSVNIERGLKEGCIQLCKDYFTKELQNRRTSNLLCDIWR